MAEADLVGSVEDKVKEAAREADSGVDSEEVKAEGSEEAVAAATAAVEE